MTGYNFIASAEPLLVGNAVAAILVLEDGRYIMQLRDDIPGIWYPDHWGLFGGTVEPGESPVDALRRELHEELELEFAQATLFTSFEFDLTPLGLECYYRKYFEVHIASSEWERSVLHEGADVRALSPDAALALPRISPYDAFALFLHARQARISRRVL